MRVGAGMRVGVRWEEKGLAVVWDFRASRKAIRMQTKSRCLVKECWLDHL